MSAAIARVVARLAGSKNLTLASATTPALILLVGLIVSSSSGGSGSPTLSVGLAFGTALIISLVAVYGVWVGKTLFIRWPAWLFTLWCHFFGVCTFFITIALASYVSAGQLFGGWGGGGGGGGGAPPPPERALGCPAAAQPSIA